MSYATRYHERLFDSDVVYIRRRRQNDSSSVYSSATYRRSFDELSTSSYNTELSTTLSKVSSKIVAIPEEKKVCASYTRNRKTTTGELICFFLCIIMIMAAVLAYEYTRSPWVRSRTPGEYLDKAAEYDRHFYEQFHYELRILREKYRLPSSFAGLKLKEMIDKQEEFQNYLASVNNNDDSRVDLAMNEYHNAWQNGAHFSVILKAIGRVVEAYGCSRAMEMYELIAKDIGTASESLVYIDSKLNKVELNYNCWIEKFISIIPEDYQRDATKYWSAFVRERTPIVRSDCIRIYSWENTIQWSNIHRGCFYQGKEIDLSMATFWRPIWDFLHR